MSALIEKKKKTCVVCDRPNITEQAFELTSGIKITIKKQRMEKSVRDKDFAAFAKLTMEDRSLLPL